MCVYDKTLGMSSQLSTCKEVYVKTSEGKVDKSFTPTFRSFYDSLSNEEIERLWCLALINLGLVNEPGYCDLEPHSIEFIIQEFSKVEPTIWKYLMVAVGYPKSKVMRLNYQHFADTQGLLGFERVITTKGEVEKEAFEYLQSVRPNDRIAGCLYKELDLRGVKYVMFDLDNKKLPIMVFANNHEDTNPFFKNSNQIMIKQPKGYLPNQFEITDGGNVYDITYIKLGKVIRL